ncbi:hypothetical protein JANAI62_11980 [Jannaschia pagri]|uniref:DUF2155 domain-containing protein n=1 Tax=Jannaschia pagri TaxID=2829797 RepID=A0ABQ4NK05_9RHOB|nr:MULTISPECIES: DUF2155 domain-containing protein [unclassified Jannaschia]GIT90743.1 hypothetical protein JANAI61_12010 [Jannaschia sp. AI_61]GIT94575.1 hypothetical protein JANAI62_11980 [Jannaschia sp. AI_62]
MLSRAALLLCLAFATGAQAQAVRTGAGPGAVLRTLDKTSGEVVDVEMAIGQTMAYGPLQVTLHDCRYPANNPSGDAFALVQVVDARAIQELFAGWMVASSPALNALEHRRYDVWVLRCLTSLN